MIVGDWRGWVRIIYRGVRVDRPGSQSLQPGFPIWTSIFGHNTLPVLRAQRISRKSRPGAGLQVPTALLCRPTSPNCCRAINFSDTSPILHTQPQILQPACYPLGLHAFRHFRVTMLVEAGAPVHTIKAWIGHGSERMVARYTHSRPAYHQLYLASVPNILCSSQSSQVEVAASVK